MQEIREYARIAGVEPTTIVQRATTLGGSAWKGWEAGKSCTLNTASQLRAYMAANPASEPLPQPKDAA